MIEPDIQKENHQIGTLPVSSLVPMDYRYAFDVAITYLAYQRSPMIRCQVPEYTAEVRQRFPHWIEAAGQATVGLWVEPLQMAWEADLAAFQAGLAPGSHLLVISSRPFARWLGLRNSQAHKPLGMHPFGLYRLRRALAQAGFTIENHFGVHSFVSISLNVMSGVADSLGRPDFADRLQFAARLHYCKTGFLANLSTVALLIACSTSTNIDTTRFE